MSATTIPHRDDNRNDDVSDNNNGDTPINIPPSLENHIRTTRLQHIVQTTRAAVQSNARVLAGVCDRMQQLELRIDESERRNSERIDQMAAQMQDAVRSAQESAAETKRLATECVTQGQLAETNKKLSERLDRLEKATGEILPAVSSHDDEGGAGETPTIDGASHRPLSYKRMSNKTVGQTPSSGDDGAALLLGPLGKFVSDLITRCTSGPLAELYDDVTDEWDSAFSKLSDDAFHEIAEAQHDVRLARQEMDVMMEEAQRAMIHMMRDERSTSLGEIKNVVTTLERQSRNSIEAFGFDVRREVASMLHQTKQQAAILQRAITRLRNTLCLPQDTETIAHSSSSAPSPPPPHSHVQQAPSSSYSAVGNATMTLSPIVLSSPLSQQQQQQQDEQEEQGEQGDEKGRGSSGSAIRKRKPKEEASFADDGKKRRRTRTRRANDGGGGGNGAITIVGDNNTRDSDDHRHSDDDDDDDDDDGDATSSCSSSSEPNPEMFQSMFVTKSFLTGSSSPTAATAGSPRSSSSIAAAMATSTVNNSNVSNTSPAHVVSFVPQQQQQQHPPQHQEMMMTVQQHDQTTNPHHKRSALDFFGASTMATDVDVEGILQTPIFAAMRDMIEQTARAEIDAQNTLRESQFVTDLEDIRQQIMKKVNLETVHKLIERSRDRKAAAQLEYVSKAVQDLQATLTREVEWRAILKSKADFSLVDQVRVDVSRQCQMLGEDVRRLERAVVVGFGESLHVAPPATFEKVEQQRLEDEAEIKKLYLERGSHDEAMVEEIVHNHRQGVVMEDEVKQIQKLHHHQHPDVPKVQDARSTVMVSPRQFLHSAPPSRPSNNNNNGNISSSISGGGAADAGGGGPPTRRVASAGGRGTSRHFTLPQRDGGGNSSRGGTPSSSGGGMHDDYSDSVVSGGGGGIVGASNSSQGTQPATMFATTTRANAQQQQQHTPQRPSSSSSSSSITGRQTPHSQQKSQPPPRHSLIYTGAVGQQTPPSSSSSSARRNSPPTSWEQGSGQSSATPEQFQQALKQRCRLSEDAVKKW